MRAPPGPLLGLFLLTAALGSQLPARLKGAAPPGKAPNAPDFLGEVRPLLKTYCFECHGTNKRRAGLDLEKLDTPAALDGASVWGQVGERLRSKEMPPGNRKQPTEGERQKLLAWVRHAAESRVDCRNLTKTQLEQALAGHTTNRRLSRFEYNNTLRDLFGVDLRAGDLLPSEGGGGEGFDNAGATLFTTPVLMEKYLEAAELVLDTLLSGHESAPEKPGPERTADLRLEELRRKLVIAVPGPKMTPR